MGILPGILPMLAAPERRPKAGRPCHAASCPEIEVRPPPEPRAYFRGQTRGNRVTAASSKMNSRFVLLPLRLSLSTVVGTWAFAQSPVETSFPSTAEIRTILSGRVGAEDQGIGLVVGLIDGSGRRVVAYGSLAKNDPGPLDGDTVFEIGSITKVFTTLLLMDHGAQGEVT